MKNNWLKIFDFDDEYGFAYDNLAIILDCFFENLLFDCYDDKGNIIVKDNTNNKKYLVKKENNKMRLYIKAKEKDYFKIIDKKLKLYRYQSYVLDKNEYLKTMGLQIMYNSLDKKIYIDDKSIDLSKTRINIFDTMKLNYKNDFELIDSQRASSISCNSDIFNNFNCYVKYGCPDLSFGTNIYRNSDVTIKNYGYYNSGVRNFSSYNETDHVIPIVELALETMNTLYNDKKYKIVKKDLNNKRKIGF